MSRTLTAMGTILVLVSGCGGAGAGTAVATLVPPRYGTLTQAQFTLELVRGALQIQVTPLTESVIRLAAPDTYQRLAGLSASAGESLSSRAREDSILFLVSMFTRDPTITYEPENLHIVNGGLRYRPTAIEAITPGWGEHAFGRKKPNLRSTPSIRASSWRFS
jgi:hypothetical protein